MKTYAIIQMNVFVLLFQTFAIHIFYLQIWSDCQCSVFMFACFSYIYLVFFYLSLFYVLSVIVVSVAVNNSIDRYSPKQAFRTFFLSHLTSVSTLYCCLCGINKWINAGACCVGSDLIFRMSKDVSRNIIDCVFDYKLHEILLPLQMDSLKIIRFNFFSISFVFTFVCFWTYCHWP